MKFNLKSPFLMISYGILLFACVMNMGAVLGFLQDVIGLIFPILLGLLFAFVLNVPMRGFERLFHRGFEKTKRKPGGHTIQALSLMLTLICIVLVITLACTLAIPALISSVRSIAPLLKVKLPEWTAFLNSYEIDLSAVTDWLNGLNWEQVAGNAGMVLGSAVDAATSTISVISSFIFGTIIAIYILLSKETLSRQVKKLIRANFKKETADGICYVAVLARDTYAKFLSGQCAEAIILGILIFLAFSLFGLPYAGLTGFLTSLFAFVPYVGAFASCAIGVFLTLLVNPEKALLCLLVYMVVQFIENQFIYPHVVGGSVGLAPLWTLLATLIGGKLFGLVGIIFFIPLTATLYTLIRDDTNRKLTRNNDFSC